MPSKDEIKSALQSNQDILNSFLADLSDEDITVPQRMTFSSIAWQMGHLIATEMKTGALVPGTEYPELPAGMNVAYARETAGITPPAGYLKKAEYLDLFNTVRSATLAALDRLADADLDRPTTEPLSQWAPTLGDLLLLMANHTQLTVNGLMHFWPADEE